MVPTYWGFQNGLFCASAAVASNLMQKLSLWERIKVPQIQRQFLWEMAQQELARLFNIDSNQTSFKF